MKNCLKGCIVLKFYYLLKNGKIENCSQHLSFFSFFLLKWNCGKLGDKYAFFSIFSFFEQNGKNEKMVRIKMIFFIFRFSIFGKKRKNRKMSQELDIISFFSFSNNSKKIKNSKISLLAVYSIFCIFEANFKIRKMKN